MHSDHKTTPHFQAISKHNQHQLTTQKQQQI